jgi:predicted CoA-binding protein
MGRYRAASEARVAEIVRDARVVAVVGMKGERDRAAPAFYVPQAMQGHGIRLVPVNPMIDEALGAPALKAVADLTEKVDVIQIFRRPELVPALADEILALPAERRPAVVWLQTGIIHEGAAEKLTEAGIEVIMDRCFMVDARRYRG